MKKQILFLFIAVLAAVLISGCLGGDSADDLNESVPENETNEFDPENESNEPNEADPEVPDTNYPGPSDANIITAFNASLVTLNPLPEGFVHLATRSVTSNKQNIGVYDALVGYRGMYLYQEGYDDYNVYVAVYKCSSSKMADEHIQKMEADHLARYGAENVSTVYVNGHSAVLLSSAADNVFTEGNYVMAWSNWSGDEYDDSYLVVINGAAPYSLIMTAAEASDL
jgi:hypothetical protein